MNDPAPTPAPTNPLAKIAEVRGLSRPFAFAMDGDSKPGKVIYHFVRLETVEFDEGDVPPFMVRIDEKKQADPRMEFLAETFTGPASAVIRQLLGICSLLMSCVSDVLAKPIAMGTKAERIKWSHALTLASRFMQTGATPPSPSDDVR